MKPYSSKWCGSILFLAGCLIGPAGVAQPPPEKVALTGTVVAADTREPIEEAILTLRRTSEVPVGKYRGGRMASDGTGNFLFPEVEEGTYQLRVQAKGYRDLVQPLRVQGPQPPPLELALAPLPVLTGRLLRPNGTPLDQAEFQVYLSIYRGTPKNFSSTPWDPGGSAQNPLTTGRAGEYRVPLNSSGRGVIVFVAPEGGWGGFSFTAPEGEDVTAPELTLSPLASLQGQVRRQGTEEPIPQARVVVNLVGGTGQGTVTDEEGRFTFQHLRSGTIRLSASASGYQGRSQRIHAPPGEEVTGLICELSPRLSLRGRLLDPDGGPLKQVTAQVTLVRPTRSSAKKEVVTDAEGYFTVALPGPGCFAPQIQVPDLGWVFGSWFSADEEDLLERV